MKTPAKISRENTKPLRSKIVIVGYRLEDASRKHGCTKMVYARLYTLRRSEMFVETIYENEPSPVRGDINVLVNCMSLLWSFYDFVEQVLQTLRSFGAKTGRSDFQTSYS